MDANLGDLVRAVADDKAVAAQLRARKIATYGLAPNASDEAILSAETSYDWRQKRIRYLNENRDEQHKLPDTASWDDVSAAIRAAG